MDFTDLNMEAVPGSKTIGVLYDFWWDMDIDVDYQDDDEYHEGPTWNAYENEVQKRVEKEFPYTKQPKWPGYGKDEKSVEARKAHEKWYQQRHDCYDLWNDRKTEEAKALWRSCKQKAKEQVEKEQTRFIEKARKHLSKSTFEVIVGVTNHNEQKKMEQLLALVGFKKILKFTNPHHKRKDPLNLWLIRPKDLATTK